MDGLHDRELSQLESKISRLKDLFLRKVVKWNYVNLIERYDVRQKVKVFVKIID